MGEAARHPTILEHEAELHGRQTAREDGFFEGRELGHLEALRLAITTLYTARFGVPVPGRLRAAVDAQDVFTELIAWNTALGTRSKEEAERLILGLDD